MSLRTAVVGAGTVSGSHLSGLAENPRTDLLAVCDVNRESATRAAREHSIVPYTNVDRMIADLDLDCVHVCTPVGTHLPIAERTIEAGIPTVIEKPVTETLEELERLESLAAAHGVPVIPVHQHRFDPAMRRVEELLETGALGTLRGVNLVYSGHTRPDEANRGSWVFDLLGGEFEEGLPHPIYLTLSTGGYPRSEGAICARVALSTEYDRGFAYDGAQLGYVTDEEVLCSATMIAGGMPKRQIHVHGDDRSVVADMILQTVRTVDSDYARSSAAKALRNVDIATQQLAGLGANVRAVAERAIHGDWERKKALNPHFYQFDLVSRALEEGGEPPVSLTESWWTIRLMEELRTAADGESRVPLLDGE
ncbi:Gfo/Idh/MocA family protein [Natronorarus salvus]|uniref:Gfo/Idh/MocA family protein n=1 Tax=Natronorarus salvus TaxID=3117733 RepID=UPI002F26A5C3